MTSARNRKRVTGAILCGGASSRMGAPKHTMILNNGRMMIEHVREAMAHLCEPIVLLDSASEAQGWSSLRLAAQIIPDLRPNHGPLGGIEALLSSGVSDEYIVCPCDVPRITSEVFEALLEETDARSTVLRIEGSDAASPLPARFSARALPVVTRLLDEGFRAVHHLHERLGAHVVEVPAHWDELLMNVNTPQDLARLVVPAQAGTQPARGATPRETGFPPSRE